MGIDELEDSLHSPEGEKISNVSFAENARDEGGYSSFVVLDTRRGSEVAEASRFCEETLKAKPQRQHLEEEVNKLQDATR